MLSKTNASLDHIRAQHLVLSDPEVKQMLTQHLIVLAVAETEEAVESRIVSYFESHSTPPAVALATSSLNNLLRSIKTSEIAGFLNRLGGDFKARFQDYLKTDQSKESGFNNLVVNRHSVVHEASCTLTLEEFIRTLPSVDFVISALDASLVP